MCSRRFVGFHQIPQLIFCAWVKQVKRVVLKGRMNSLTRRTDYCCQEDGMIGLGPGARSYTRSMHYSTEYAVGQTGVRILKGKVQRHWNDRDLNSFR